MATFVSSIAVFVLTTDVTLQPTWQLIISGKQYRMNC